MTEVGLFPRGKPSTDVGVKSNPRGGSDKQDQAGRKRKAVPSPSEATPVGGDGDGKGWLFGTPRAKHAASEKKLRRNEAGRNRTGTSVRTPTQSVKDVGSGMLVEHAGRAPRLEMVSFKKLSKGSLALGVVFKVNENDMVISLPSSLTGVVRRREVSDYFHLKAVSSGANRQQNRPGSKGRYFEEDHEGDSPLSDLFREGQVVRCAILSLAKEAKGRHIELSLRASVLNKGTCLSQLTKGSGVYGSVVSVEDHGYVITLGLDGVTAFLPAADAPKGGLKAGQPVETVIKMVKAAARTVTLSAEPSLVSTALAKGTSYDLRSLKPGMLVDTIVDNVLSNGMLVSFLGYFAGCVDHNNMPIVSGDGKDEKGGWRSLFRAGPEPVRARILLVDYINKAVRLTLRPHLMEMRAPTGLPSTGALLEGEIVRVDPALGLLLTVPSTDGDGGEAIGNAAPPKKEKGQARKERRAAEQDGSATDPGGMRSVGAYIHISRISDERIEHVEKAYKPGQKVQCRVTGSSLVEGWSAASLRPSVLSAAVLRYQDLRAGSLVEGEVAAVEAFGLLIKLGEGVRALVPKNHLGDVTVKNPKTRFKVGARVKGKVLTVDASSSKATLTLKRSMLKDKRPAITTFEEAKQGVACTGFVTKVAAFGLHVSFYGNVFGLLPAKALTRHGIEDPSEAFTVGQVIGCVVRTCDGSTSPPKLTLALDVAGKTEQMDNAATNEGEESDGDDAVACPVSVSDILSGVVSAKQDAGEGTIAIDLSVSLPPLRGSAKKKKSPPKDVTVRGVLAHSHLGDHASVCGETLASRMTPGTKLDQVLVLEVDRRGTPIVSLKPILLAATAAATSSKTSGSTTFFIPREAADVSPGDLVAGFVSRVESFGVFVKFFGKFSALCPRSMAADKAVEDPRGMFMEGDSVRCVVQRVDSETNRVVVTLNRKAVPASPGLYLRSLLWETVASAHPEGRGSTPPAWGRFEFGATCNAVVVAKKEYGVVLKAAVSGKQGDQLEGGQLMVCPLEHAMDGVEEGNEVKVRVLGVDVEKGVVDVSMDTDLVKAGRSKRRKSMVPLEPGEVVSARIILAKPDSRWAVASSKDGRLFVVQVADFHCPHRTCEDDGITVAAGMAEAKEIQARVGESFTPGYEGFWESQEVGSGTSLCNPYASALLIVAEEGGAGKKVSRRKVRGDSLDLGVKNVAEGEASNPMKTGRVPLGKIVAGAKVTCEVTSIHWDRLDVKVAIRYPKSYGPGGSKSQAGDDDHEDETVEREQGGRNRKRPRAETESAKEEGRGADHKQIVRIRAKVHCTAAGLPGLDAPAITDWKANAGEDSSKMPEWHPLEKYHVGEVLEARVLHSEDASQKERSNLRFRLLELGVKSRLDENAAIDASADDEAAAPEMPWWGQRPPKKGEVHRGVITDVTEHGVLVSLSTSVRGLVPLAHMSADEAVAKDHRAYFQRGMGVRAAVRSVDGKRRHLILSLRGVPAAEVLPDSALPAMSPGLVEKKEAASTEGNSLDPPRPGAIVEGTVDVGLKRWAAPCLMIRLDDGGIGRVCVTEMDDVKNWKNQPLPRFKDGERVKCRVLQPVINRHSSFKAKLGKSPTDGEAGDRDGPLELSLRESRLSQDQSKEDAVERQAAPNVGSTVTCYVVDTGKSGCFVRLDGGVTGRVLLKLLADRFVSDPKKEFPAGKLVAGKVLSKDKSTGQLSLSLQPSVVLTGAAGDEGGGITWGSPSLKKGLKIKGRVVAVQDFGVFIQLDESEVRGMCHRSQAADKSIKDLTKFYDIEDLVKAVVLKVERGKKRISLGLKPSYFQGDPDSSDEESVDETRPELKVESVDGDESGDGEMDESDAESEAEGEKKGVVDAMDASEEEVESEDGEISDEEEEEKEDERSSKRPRGVLEGGMGGESSGSAGASAFSLNFGDLGSLGGAGASSDEDEDSDESEDGVDAPGGKGHRARKKARDRREEEDRIAAKERTLQDQTAEPETAGDYERLLIAAPNNSLLWVKYMAFKLSLADVEGARSVCERGLKAVSFREEQERFNLWVSLINLEHKFGSRATLKSVSERACQNSNPKKVFLHVAEMHEKAQETDECEEAFQAAAKKFRHSKKVWTAYQLSRLRRGDDAGARQVLQRSLQSLSKHKHISVISRFAQNEFEHGSVERGRAVFEGLMASYPKRLDLWNVYLDKEIKAGDVRAARNLLDRLTGMEFNAKRMKGVFKKYLQFEMDHGDEAGVESVKAKATEYVASLAG